MINHPTNGTLKFSTTTLANQAFNPISKTQIFPSLPK